MMSRYGLRDEEARALRAALQRLRENYALWARNFATILDKRGQLIKLRLNHLQRRLGAIERCELKQHGKARIYVLKARQGGVSTDQQARMLHLAWSQPHTLGITLGATTDDTRKLFQISRRIIDNFPRKVKVDGVTKPVDMLHALGDAETREITFPDVDSFFWTGTAGAKRTGRGVTLVRVHCSEYAYWDDPVGTMAALTPALRPVGSVIVKETTASTYDSPAHRDWRRAEQGESGYVAVFFPWWECDPDFYRLPLLAPDELGKLEPDEEELVKLYGLTLEQIKWRRTTIKEFSSKADFLKEYAENAEECWLSAGDTYYDADMLKALSARAPEPVRTENLLGGTLSYYVDPQKLGKRVRVIVGADTAEGGGGDRSTWIARSFPDWEPLLAFQSSVVTPEDFADLLNTWGRRLNYAFLVIEKNGHGITVLRRLTRKHRYRLSRIFHREPLSKRTDERTRYMGWVTTEESKPLLLSAGAEILRGAHEGLHPPPPREVLTDAFAVAYDKRTGKLQLTGRDMLVADMLAWVGREQVARTAVPRTTRPVQWG